MDMVYDMLTNMDRISLLSVFFAFSMLNEVYFTMVLFNYITIS